MYEMARAHKPSHKIRQWHRLTESPRLAYEAMWVDAGPELQIPKHLMWCSVVLQMSVGFKKLSVY